MFVKEVWTRWFSALSPWIGQSLPYERLAWITIRGVLPHLVSRTVFDSIRSRYGKVVQSSQFLETDGDLTSDRLGILVDSGNNINGILNLSWQDKKYKVWVIEENDAWIPDFLEDDEDSVATSSELGDNVVGQDRSNSEFRGVEDKEDEEAGNVLAKGDDKSLETQGSPGSQYFMVGDSGLHGSVRFNMGRPNCVKPNKISKVSSNFKRPKFCSVKSAFTDANTRPKKRSRAVMEDNCISSSQASLEVNGGDGSNRGFEQFFFDLNNLAPSENAVPDHEVDNSVEEIQSKGEEGGENVKNGGGLALAEIEKEIVDT
ncbi:hypothetical protein Hanom_Chr15g01358361 [Helianthus anomalus]